MRIGVPSEIKNNENRVAMTPAGVVQLVKAGHEVFIQKGAGLGSGFTDKHYIRAGAVMVEGAAEAWSMDMVMKVKEPIPVEYDFFRPGQILFTYLHLAPERELTKELVNKKVIGIAYETVQLDNGSLPLLTPMSEVAGRMSTQLGAQFLQKPDGGKGILLGGVPGVRSGKIAIIGGGVAGTNALKIAVGLGADVSIIDVNPDRLRELDDITNLYLEFKDDISYFVNLCNAAKEAKMNVSQVVNLLKLANNDIQSIDRKCQDLKLEESSLNARNLDAARTFEQLSSDISE